MAGQASCPGLNAPSSHLDHLPRRPSDREQTGAPGALAKSNCSDGRIASAVQRLDTQLQAVTRVPIDMRSALAWQIWSTNRNWPAARSPSIVCPVTVPLAAVTHPPHTGPCSPLDSRNCSSVSPSMPVANCSDFAHQRRSLAARAKSRPEEHHVCALCL